MSAMQGFWVRNIEILSSRQLFLSLDIKKVKVNSPFPLLKVEGRHNAASNTSQGH
jgi:hypothetical protein